MAIRWLPPLLGVGRVPAPPSLTEWSEAGGPLQAGSNTINVSAPTASRLASIILAAGVLTATVTAPAATLRQVDRLSAGSNTVNVSAPTATTRVTITLAAGSNTVNVSAPAPVVAAEIELAAGSNTVNVSAPTVTLDISTNLSAGANTVNVSAPAQSQTVRATLAAGANTVNVSAPEATIPTGGEPVNLEAGSNTINVSAPVATTAIRVPAGANTVNVSAPGATLYARTVLTPISGDGVIWTNVLNCTVSGNLLTRNRATDANWGLSGACSLQILNSGDGRVDYTLGSDLGTYRMFSLSNGDLDWSYTTLDFAIFFVGPTQTIEVWENNSIKWTSASSYYTTGDKFSVVLSGGTVTYQKNDVTFYTSLISPTYPLLVDAAMYTLGASLQPTISGNWTGGEGSIVAVSAPVAYVGKRLPAGSNTINVSAPNPTLNLKLLAGSNIIYVSAPPASIPGTVSDVFVILIQED